MKSKLVSVASLAVIAIVVLLIWTITPSRSQSDDVKITQKCIDQAIQAAKDHDGGRSAFTAYGKCLAEMK